MHMDLEAEADCCEPAKQQDHVEFGRRRLRGTFWARASWTVSMGNVWNDGRRITFHGCCARESLRIARESDRGTGDLEFRRDEETQPGFRLLDQ